ncbi:zinc ribbon domain-containing protein [Fusobacterium massiliense]|jgi:zinc finger protein|uniref:zinc ribbon domain-containing protein n=1 Tax=Fusobacterium massiliense TaxID=1852365 RepID=UPI00093F8779|nr:zinc ribbon domain-containing protein [Fusobacterium massiliense]
MKLEFSCPKCRCRKCDEKSIILPEKRKNKIKIELNVYYAKTCLNCGYTEFYSAKVVDEDSIKKECDADVKLEGSF